MLRRRMLRRPMLGPRQGCCGHLTRSTHDAPTYRSGSKRQPQSPPELAVPFGRQTEGLGVDSPCGRQSGKSRLGDVDQHDAQGPRTVDAFDALELDIAGGTTAADPGERSPAVHRVSQSGDSFRDVGDDLV